jgi:hypothetical protein
MEGREEEGRDLNYLCVWFKMKSGGEGFWLHIVFGSEGEGRDSKINLPFNPFNLIIVYNFKTIFHIVKWKKNYTS